MSDVVLDANVLVGLLERSDSLHQRSTELLERIQRDGGRPVMLDIIVAETVSALCRRATQRKASPPDLAHVRDQVHAWLDAGPASSPSCTTPSRRCSRRSSTPPKTRAAS